MISRDLEADVVDRVKQILTLAGLAMTVRAYPSTVSEIRSYTPEHERGEILVRRSDRNFTTNGVDVKQSLRMELTIFIRELRDLDGGNTRHGGLYDVFDELIDKLTGYTPSAICKGKYVPVSDDVLGYVGEFWVGEMIFEIEGYYPHKRT